MKSEKELWSFSDNIMHYNIMLKSGKRVGDKEGLSWNSWKLIWLALNCSLHLGNNKQSDKKWRHNTIVKTIAGPDLRLSVSRQCPHNYEWYQSLILTKISRYTTTPTALTHYMKWLKQNQIYIEILCLLM